jgi:tRNA (guanine10-N2)-dimethyltransferase
MASPHYVDLEPMVAEVGFEIVEQYGIKMHRSLTRIISVICKKSD